MATSTIEKIAKYQWNWLAGVKSSALTADTYNTVSLNTSMKNFTLLRFNTAYYTSGTPDYGGLTVGLGQILNLGSEHLTVARYDNDYHFRVKYINDTTLSIRYYGTQSDTNCLSIHGIL